MNKYFLEKLLLESDSERELLLISLGKWEDNVPFVNSEESVRVKFEETYKSLSKFLGEPIYCGAGESYGLDIPSPKNHFDSTVSSISIAWWNAFGGEVVLFHTGHDGDSLQFVTLAISDDCVLKTPNKEK
jgi:hypothetical protein